MSTLLRRTGRLAAQSLRAPSRRTYIPRQRLSPQCIYAQARTYASVQPGPPEEPKKDDKDGKKKLDKKQKDEKVEEAKQDAKASSADEIPPGHLKLSQHEEEQLDKLFTLMTEGMPKDVRKQAEEAKTHIKKHGIPEQFREALKKRERGESLSIGEMTELTKAAFKYGEDMLEGKSVGAREPDTENPQQKSGAYDPGPQSDKKWDKGKAKFGSSGKSKSKDEKSAAGQFDVNLFWIAAFTTYLLYRMAVPGENSREITWQEFRNTFLDKGLVEKVVVVNQTRAKVYLHRESVAAMYPESPAAQGNFVYYFSIGSVEAFERKMEQAQAELGIPNHERIPVAYSSEVSWVNYLLSFGPTLLFIGAIFFFSRRAASGAGGGSGIFSMGRSRAKKFNHETDIKVKFSDVAGMDEAKTEIMEFVSFLKEPGIYQKLGAKIPRGAILSGPPGTGKTLLAKATAGESGVPFFSVSGSEFVEMFVGVGPSRVRDLFANARKSTPCIIFIDEIDAIGKSRSKNNFGGGNDERESTLNQILTEMDGFNTSEQVVVLAGTNRPDVLDKALMRPGRFDRHIAIDRPTLEGRKQIFAVHLKKIVTKEDLVHLGGRLASLTPGFSGADIANCVNEAALVAARFMANSVEMTHFEQAIERVIVGLEKKSLVLSPEEKRTVAYHEAGHAICGWFFEWADPLLKVSIIPRGQGALGYAQYLPSSDNYLMNVNQLMDRMAMTLGGRVSEELHFPTVTTGASDDFKKVTQMATAMVTKWGMTQKVGFLYFEDDPSSQMHKPFSEETAKNIDIEVRRIVDEAYTQCRNMLIEKKAELELVAEELLKKEMIGRDDLIRILGPRPFPDKGEWSKYFGSKGDKEGSEFGTPSPSGPGKQEGGDLGSPGTPTPAMFKRR